MGRLLGDFRKPNRTVERISRDKEKWRKASAS
jgi:hypothetical protein